ncbi:MAG: adenylyl-sulfate kinase [Desulfomonilaceae bacterium]
MDPVAVLYSEMIDYNSILAVPMNARNGKTIWLTGLSGSGKSTLSSALKMVLESRGGSVVLLDGDALRAGLNRDLGFSALDRAENIRRVAEVAKILCDAGHIVVAAFITPLESLRQAVRGLFGPDTFVEIFLDCPLAICESRDPKGLYSRARKGEIAEFTGISSPFERPSASDLVVPTGDQEVQESLSLILRFLEDRFPHLSGNCTHRGGASSRESHRKVAVIGLDCVPASLVFEEWGRDLPTLRALMEHGVWGSLRSTDPPITIPAWTTMTTGKDPGELGVYGFRNRQGNDYREMAIANSSHVQVPRVWDYLEDVGKSSILLGIPQTYPARPHRGITVPGFPVPAQCSEFTYPAELAAKLPGIAGGEYLPDVKNFRDKTEERLLSDIYSMMDRRFRVAADLLIHKSWDFFMMVEIAPDRLHHGFWRYLDPNHSDQNPACPYGDVIKDFYKCLDFRIGSLLALLDDEATVIVVSDHGARTSLGGVCINEWLIQNGYLHLRTSPTSEVRLVPDMIDWSRTRAWSEGGYYARIFLNVKDREPEGIVEPSDYEALRQELAVRLQLMPGENGDPLTNCILKPQEIYRACRNVPPDLMVYFDSLSRRSIGTVGHGEILRPKGSAGLDDANHDPEGIFIGARMHDLRRGTRKGKRIEEASCLDITPTILQQFDLPVPAELRGRIIQFGEDEEPRKASRMVASSSSNMGERTRNPAVMTPGYSPEEEEIVKARLIELGYI